MKHYSFDQKFFWEELGRINPELDLNILRKGYEFASRAHAGQLRRSGEDYLIHPACVCRILADLNLDTATLTAALLHDVPEDTDLDLNDIKAEFGPEIAELVDGVTKIQSYPYLTKVKRPQIQAENYRKLLISIARDIRVLLIKLADRLHNMRTLEFMPRSKQERIARETLDIYAPLAIRFGIAKFQWEMEDLSFKTLYPGEYQKLSSLVTAKKHERENFLKEIREEISKELAINGIKAKVTGRSKHFYSIYQKSRKKKIRFEEILDLIGIRIILDTVEDCYKTLGIIQTEYVPLERSLKDYIAKPKVNNYQSIHIVVSDLRNHKIEIQIRTAQMHLIAEEGIAAHWRYKQLHGYEYRNRKGEFIIPDIQTNFDDQLQWIRLFLKKQQNRDADSFINSLKINLYPDIIVVRTPENDYIELKENSTCLDFAFKVHTQVGFHCVGAYVNGMHKPVRTVLKNGDVVQILTSPRAKPSKDWLKLIHSPKARQKIRSYFRKIERQDAVERGRELLQKRARTYHLKAKTEDEILEIARMFKINDTRTFYAALGNREIEFDDILRILDKEIEPEEAAVEAGPDKTVDITSIPRITIQDIDHVMVRFAKCCNPEPGDKIVGYTTRGRGVTIHRNDCQNSGFVNLRKKEPERIIEVAWKSIKGSQ